MYTRLETANIPQPTSTNRENGTETREDHETGDNILKKKKKEGKKKNSYLGIFSALMMVEEPSSFFSFLGLRV